MSVKLSAWRGYRAGVAAAAVAAAIGVAACGGSSTSSTGTSGGSSNSSTNAASTTPASGGSAAPASYIAYTGGKRGSANPKLSPVEIGFTNDQGGSTVIAGTDPTLGAEGAVKWINKYADGIDGHPLKLVTCFVQNSESEGQQCAEQFMANKNISVINYGAMSLGATSIDQTVAGKKPIVAGVSINPPDLTTKNLFTLFAAVPYLDYPWATFAKNYLHATTAALLYPNQAGQQEVMAAVQKAMEVEGIKTKLVGFDPDSTSLTGALEAAGATTAGVISANVATPSQCLAFAQSATQLGISPSKVIGLFQCQIPSIKSQYPGGDYPEWNYTTTSPAPYENTTAGKEYRTVFGALGLSASELDPWTLVEFADVMTEAKWMNAIGVSKISPATIEAQARAFAGPQLLGPDKLDCGKYPSAPAVCADGESVLTYQGDGKYASSIPYVETPPTLQRALGAKTITQ